MLFCNVEVNKQVYLSSISASMRSFRDDDLAGSEFNLIFVL